MTTTDEECRKRMENYFIAPLCGLFLGLIAETFICSWSWLETGPMIRFSNGVRLPFIGPLLGAILAYLFSTKFGQIKLQGWFKYWAVGAIFGLLTGFFIGAGILAPILARSDPDYSFFGNKVVASYTRFFIVFITPLSGILGASIGLLLYCVIRRKGKTHD